MEFIFFLAILLFSIVLHEVAHGFVAQAFGDPTAKYAGRLTLNPIPHIDPFGTIILPLLMAIPALFGAPPIIFGWAKPVPVDPRYFKNPRKGMAAVSVAGVAVNFFVAAVFGLVIRWAMPALASFLEPTASGALQFMLAVVVEVNLLLGIFNMLPLPPLDGSRLLFAALPSRFSRMEWTLERYGLIILIVFIFFFAGAIGFLVNGAFRLLTGLAFAP